MLSAALPTELLPNDKYLAGEAGLGPATRGFSKR